MGYLGVWTMERPQGSLKDLSSPGPALPSLRTYVMKWLLSSWELDDNKVRAACGLGSFIWRGEGNVVPLLVKWGEGNREGPAQNLPRRSQLWGTTSNHVSEGSLFLKRGKPSKLLWILQADFNCSWKIPLSPLPSLHSLGSGTVPGWKWSGWRGGNTTLWKTQALEAWANVSTRGCPQHCLVSLPSSWGLPHSAGFTALCLSLQTLALGLPQCLRAST